MIEAPLQRFTQVYRQGQAIFQENSSGSEMFVVYAGKVDLYKEFRDKRVLVDIRAQENARTIMEEFRPIFEARPGKRF